MKCTACRDGVKAPFDFTMAFQPIVSLSRRNVWAYEALVRGPDGQGAPWVLDQINDENKYAFDQSCRVKAIELAAGLFGGDADGARLSINFLPNAVYTPAACIRTTMEAADRTGFPAHRIMLEFTEGEKITDVDHVKSIIREYKARKLITAIDDFGAGFSGLGLLAEFQPDVIKLDMGLIRGIDDHPGRQAIVSGILSTSRLLGLTVIAEGIETLDEMQTLQGLGIDLMQGFLFARPALAALPDIRWPDAPPAALTA
ncbi:EAL domain-containing protein [Alkalicaulis satelles]|uniref:EAL domain-containing protein n=1 Tax=Alkalicaulis satelles TaxID=2609175 RepID=A0A5M6ZK97_9PROT|nr:EAL domain-containing protein [Alkalicaulis satelles]KAA5804760.1 EAL domain-containing protein [Alkalicaulis satelles]